MSEQFQFTLNGWTAEPVKRRISKAFLSAYRAGRNAARRGQKKYPPYRNHQDWRRAFRHYWVEGFADFQAGRAERYQSH